MENVVELLKEWSTKTPGKNLFVDGKNFTYQDVYNAVLKKASKIASLGLNKNPIIVFVGRDAETLINFFSVAISNNYYIPLDKNIPFIKLQKIISLTNAKYHLGTYSMSDKLSLINIDNLADTFEIKDFEFFKESFDKTNLLYVMFTSGSTGDPKGVLKSHENVLAFLDNFSSTFPFINEENIANQAPFFFDASAKDIYLTLKTNSTLYIPKKEVFSLPTETLNYLEKNRISLIYWVPSILSMIAKTRVLSFIKPSNLKYVFFVGEVFQPKYLNMWLDSMPNLRYFNTYGSTEIAGVACFYEIKAKIEENYIPIGKPISGNEVNLIDSEIVIKSKQVALGYLSHTSSTFEITTNGVLLHTGDYAKYDKDGNIVFESRKDFQIKHLGYRIELQEIEATLTNIDYIDTCCAVFNTEKDQIVLFCTLNQNILDASKDIIIKAKNLLQFYMVPNKVIVLDEMPLNSNSKIDRVKLKGML